MKKFLLFSFALLTLFTACSDNDDNNTPIAGLEIPKFEDPIKPGASITIKGEGFTAASEIWFRQIVSKAADNGDVQATVTEVTATSITFTAPEVYGNQSVLLKENGKEYELGKMVFEEQPKETTDVEILPKKVSKIIRSNGGDDVEEIYNFIYDADGKIKSMKTTFKSNQVGTSTFVYASDKITIETHDPNEDINVTMELKDGKLSAYTRNEDEGRATYDFKYTYIPDGYLHQATGVLTEEYEGEKYIYNIEETYSFVGGNLQTRISQSETYSETLEFVYGSQLNNLNIDLFTYISWELWSNCAVYDGILPEVLGKRSQYLPSSMKYMLSDDEGEKEFGEFTFSYKMAGDYITEMVMHEEGDQDTKIQIFYEE